MPYLAGSLVYKLVITLIHPSISYFPCYLEYFFNLRGGRQITWSPGYFHSLLINFLSRWSSILMWNFENWKIRNLKQQISSQYLSFFPALCFIVIYYLEIYYAETWNWAKFIDNYKQKWKMKIKFALILFLWLDK